MASGTRRGSGMDAGRQEDFVSIRARVVCGFQSFVYGVSGRWRTGSFADVAWRVGIVFSGWNALRVRAEPAVAGSVEALSRRTNHACVPGGSENFEVGESAAGEFQRLQPDLDGRYGLFPFRPQWSEYAVFLRHKNKDGEAADRKQRAGLEIHRGRAGWNCVRTVWRDLCV